MGTIWVVILPMFIPYFQITPKLTKNIEAIGAIFGYFKAVQLPEGYKKEFISKVTAETVHASTAIEGNTLTEGQVKEVLEGKKIHAQEQDIKEIINYNKALDYIEKYPHEDKESISEDLIKKLNAIILQDIKDQAAGHYRTGQVIVGDYLPPKHTQVPALMEEFVNWIQNPEPQNLSPILYTGIAHYQLVAIHPFVDGNGRTTRVLTTLMLKQNGYDMTSFFALESYYNRNRKAYYEALNSADKYRIEGKPDLTSWLEYYVEGMLIEAERARSRIDEVSQKSKIVSKKQWISDIQLTLLKLTFEKETAKIADYLQVSELSRKGTYNAVNKLVTLSLLQRNGMSKGTFYTLTEKGLEYVK
ncbi:MAG TPA: Fic family protein [Patescibacteria group bacterium]|nr:Fic family protein [Patescibacteria group bacterium]